MNYRERSDVTNTTYDNLTNRLFKMEKDIDKAFDLYNPIDKILDSNTNLKNVKAIKNNDCYYLDNTPMSNDTDHIWYGLYDSTIVYKTIYLILSKTYPEQYQELRNSYPEPIRQLM